MSDDEMAAAGGVDMESNYPLDDLSGYDPQDVGSDRDVSPDKAGGVIKRLLVRGEGFKSPEKGDEVTGAWRGGMRWRIRVKCGAPARVGASEAASRHRAWLLGVFAARALTRQRRRSALRGHAAGRQRIRQQPRAQRPFRLHARHRCAAAAALAVPATRSAHAALAAHLSAPHRASATNMRPEL